MSHWKILFIFWGTLSLLLGPLVGQTPAPAEAPSAVAEDAAPATEDPEVEDAGQRGVEVETADAPKPAEHSVYGWKEWIIFEGKTKAMRVKFDSGAKTSSIHAEKVKPLEKDGEKWVRFTVFDPNRAADKVDPTVYECPVTRVARIRNADGDLSERRVVEMAFWIGGEKRRAEFTLNDRGDMINPVLLGRSVVQTLGLIDTGRTYLRGGSPKSAPVVKKPRAAPVEEVEAGGKPEDSGEEAAETPDPQVQ